MADSRLLLEGLKEYRASLQRHLVQVRTEFEQAQGDWHSFRQVYEGEAADEFRSHWDRTSSRFQEFINRSQSIAVILDERITFLEQANRTGDLR